MSVTPSEEAAVEKKSAKKDTFLTRFSKALNSIVSPTVHVFVLISGISMASMMFLTFIDVGMRYFFNLPIDGSFELTQYMMALVVSFGLGYCALRKGHVRVDILMSYIPKRASRILDVFAYILATFYTVLMAWQVFSYSSAALSDRLVSTILLIPIFPFAFLVVLGVILLIMVFFKDIIESLQEATKK